MTESNNSVMSLVDMENWEREKVLQVLARNKKLQELDDMRVQQMAVRVQLQRLSDERSPIHDRQLRFKTGVWHKELVERKNRNTERSNDEYQRNMTKLYRQLSQGSISNSQCYSVVSHDSADHHGNADSTIQHDKLKTLGEEIPQRRVREWLTSIRIKDTDHVHLPTTEMFDRSEGGGESSDESKRGSMGSH